MKQKRRRRNDLIGTHTKAIRINFSIIRRDFIIWKIKPKRGVDLTAHLSGM
jgi:hypothetical protein